MPEGAERLIRARRFVTVDPNRPTAEAVVCRGRRIVAVGKFDDLRTAHPRAEVIDYSHLFGYPGFVDPHAHLWALAEAAGKVDVGGESDPHAVLRMVASVARTGKWVWAVGFHPSDPAVVDVLQRRLDEAFAAVPVVVETIDAHAAVLNRRALRELGEPAEKGVVLLDRDAERLLRRLRRRHPLTAEHLHHAARRCLRHGITTVTEAALRAEHLPLLQRLASRPFPVDVAIAHAPMQVDEPWPPTLCRGPWRMHALKLFLDGALTSGGLWNSVPVGPITPKDGPPFPMEFYVHHLRQAQQRGWDVWIHAIGDRAVHAALDLLEKFTRKGVRRIEHIQFVRREDMPRFRALGVIPSVQPSHRWMDAPILRRAALPHEVAAYAYGSLFDAAGGGVIGSDFPIAPISPLVQLRAAVDPQAPPHARLAFPAALEAMTYRAARALGFADRGRIAPGMQADFVFYSKPLEDLVVSPPKKETPASVWKRGREVG